MGGCAHEPQTDFEAAPVAVTCPAAELPEGARCLRGTDSAGAPYLIAMPRRWNGVLVLHAHGGPTFGAPTSKRTDADLKRWAVVVRAGYAWAASAFHDSGVAVRSAAEDTERLRRIFVHDVARPKVTILHGQSWGASVAEKAAELYASGSGPSSYDGVLLTSGVLAGATRAYDFRLDLRVVYQYLCGNHPRPDEPQYPLWMGLPRDAALTRTELAARVDRCLGVRRKPAERTAEQERKLRTIADVVRIPQRSVLSHLEWATWGFRDIVQNRTHGLNPFGNVGVRYAGSDDDDALNAGVLRYRADARAVALLAADADLTGRIAVPVLTVHAIDDPTAFVEMDAAFRRTMIDSGTADHLVQTFTDDHEHSYLSDPDYPALLAALLDWVQHGRKPTPAGVAQRCMVLEAEFGPGCRFLPDYHPKPLDMRVAIEARR
ncbi:MAG TPA: hypothetical protein VF304_08295 [Casimicrobiaceae bacterium]